MNQFKILRTGILCLSLSVLACQTKSFERRWATDTREWKAHTLDEIEISVPSELPLVTIGNQNWSFLIRWTSRCPSEEIQVGYSRVPVDSADKRMAAQKHHLQANWEILGSAEKTKIRFAGPGAHGNKDNSSGLRPTTTIYESVYGVTRLVDDQLMCTVEFSKMHSAVPLSEWNYRTFFSKEEQDMIEQVANSVKLRNH